MSRREEPRARQEVRRGSRGPASPPEGSFFEILCFHVCWGCCFSCSVRSRYTICYLLKAVNSTALMSGFVCHSSSLNKKNHYCWTTRKTCARFIFFNFSPFSLLFSSFFLYFTFWNSKGFLGLMFLSMMLSLLLMMRLMATCRDRSGLCRWWSRRWSCPRCCELWAGQGKDQDHVDGGDYMCRWWQRTLQK